MRKLFFFALIILPFFSHAQCMSGSYTIGGTTPDYATVTAAVNALVTNGVCAPVTFNIRNGTYTEQLNIPAITGSSAVNTITFQSESGDSSLVTIQFTPVSASNYVIRVNGTDYLKFNAITINNLATAASIYHGTLVVTNDADYFTLEHCRLTGIVNLSSSTVNATYSLVYSDQANCDYLNIHHNLFQGNNYGVVITHLSAQVGPIEAQVRDNEFTGQHNVPIFFGATSGGTIRRNKITCTPPVLWNNKAIQATTGTSDTLRVDQNEIITSGMGVNSEGNNGPIVISNNSIIVQPSTDGVGLQVSAFSSGRVFLLHNSVLSRSGVYSPAVYFTNSPANITSKNNVFIQAGTGPVYRADALPIPGYVSDRNVLYTNSDTFALIFSSVITDRYNWALQSGQDWNSVVAAPQFVSNTDLHVTGDFSQNVPTQVELGIAHDQDGLPRDLVQPYPGAFEFNNVQNAADAGIFHSQMYAYNTCNSTQQVAVTLRNFGTQPLTSVTINFSVNNVVQTPVSWTGNLAFFDTAITYITIPSVMNGRENQVVMWTSAPNAATDPSPGNDTSTVEFNVGFMGTYTIGGVAPDFPTITAAVNDLLLMGVCGPTVFRIRNGTYTEWMEIGPIGGSSSTNTVRFTSDSGDSSLVRVLNNTSFSSTNYVFKLNGASHITFDHIWMDHPTGRVVYLLGGAHDIVLNNNLLSGTPGNGAPIIADEIASLEYNINIHHNRFTGSNIPIELRYNGTGYQQGITIDANVMQTPWLYGISIDRARNLVISHNVINGSQTAAGMLVGININMATDSVLICNNMVYGKFHTGIYLNSLAAVALSSYRVYNNFFQASVGTSAGAGIHLNLSNNVEVSNNNVRFSGLHSAAILPAACKINGGSNIILRNNIFRSEQSAYALLIQTMPSGFVSDYNNFSSATGMLVRNVNLVYADISSWQTTGYDTNSLSTNPLYVAPADLHVYNVTLRNAGTPIAYISNDIDGDMRSNPPDIGADESNAPYNDAGVIGFDTLSAICTGVNPVRVWLRNGGTVNLTQVTINWTVNTLAQPVYNWSGSLSSGDSALVVLGSYNFLASTSYTIGAHCSMPNALPDNLSYNDTCTRIITRTGMSGTYTVGGTAPDFTTPTLAVAALMSRGVCGPVTFQIRNGNYVGALYFGNIVGASAVNTIRFQSQSGDSASVLLVVNTTAALNYVVSFNNTSYVTFSRVTLQPTNATYGCAVIFNGKCAQDTISHCRILGGVVSAGTTTANQIVSTDNLGKKSVTIEHCYFYRGNQPVFWENPGGLDSFLIFRKNTCVDHYGSGITLTNIRHATITGNSFAANSTNPAYDAIALNGVTGTCEVSYNRMIGNNGRGIVLTTCGQMAGPVLRVYNNSVACAGGGMVISGCSNIGLYFNSVRVGGTQPALQVSVTGGITILNNVLMSVNGHSIYLDVVTGNLGTNHNCFWGTGWRLGASIYTSLTNWQAASGFDSNSISANPMFVSASDLHFMLPSPLSNSAVVVPGISNDIDGQPRSSTPDIGSDEQVEVPNDAGVVSALPINQACAYNTPVGITVTIKNYGYAPLTSVQLNWEVNHVPQTPISWTGNLPMNGTTQVVLTPSITFPNSTPSIVAWTDMPNGVADTLNVNDTLVIVPNFPGMFGTYTIGGVNPDFPDFTSAVNALTTGGVCMPVVFKVRNGVYNEQIMIPSISGNSSVNTIRFESEQGDSSLVTLQYAPSTAAANYTLFVNGADYLTFHQLGISTTGTSFGRIILMDGYSNHVTFSNNNIVGQPSANANFMCMQIEGSGWVDSLYFYNNRVYRGRGALNTLNANGNNHLFIHHNKFIDQYTGIMLFGQADVVFNDNELRTSVNYSPIYQLKIINCTGNIAVTGNQFQIDSAGLIVWQFEIYNNFLGPNDSVLIANNFFSINHASPAFSSHCVWANNTGQVNFVHNNLNQTGAMSADMSLYAVANPLIIQNNNFVNMTGGAMLNVDPYLTTIDYNNYYTNGNALAYIGNDTMHTLAQWQSHNVNLNSLNVDPQYFSASDLHIQQPLLVGEANPVHPMMLDIDEEVRATPAVIGADEVGASIIVTAGFTSLSSVCEMTSVQFVNTSTGAVSYQWFVNNTLTGSTTNLNYTFTSSGTFSITLIATGSQSDTLTQVINVLPAPVVAVSGNSTLCAGDSVLLNASGAGNYSWLPSASLSAPSSSSTYAFPITTTTYTVNGTSANGCQDTAQIVITVHPLPAQPVITQSSDTLYSSATSGLQWYLNGQPVPGATGTYYVPTQNGNYSVTVTDNNGCSASSASYAFIGTMINAYGASQFMLYPVPSVNGTVFILSDSLEAGQYTLSCTVVNGQLIRSIVVDHAGGLFQLNFDLPQAQGVYFIQMRNDEGLLFVKMVERL